MEEEENESIGAVAEIAWTDEAMAVENPITELDLDSDTTAF